MPSTAMAELPERLRQHRINRVDSTSDPLVSVRSALITNPENSNRAIAALYNIPDKAVGRLRAELERSGDIPIVSSVVGTDGRRRRLRRKGADAQTARSTEPRRGEEPQLLAFTANRYGNARPKPRNRTAVLDKLRSAFSGNPLAFLVGTAFGAFVPVATWTLTHFEAQTLPHLAMVAGGCAFSALTVVEWARRVWNWPKALGFALLVEGAMLTSQTRWLSMTALGLLILINSVAAACSLVSDERTEHDRFIPNHQRGNHA